MNDRHQPGSDAGTTTTEGDSALPRGGEYFRFLVENTSDIITILNQDGTIRYGSPSVERMLGYNPDDMVGKSVLDFVHPEDAAAVVQALSHLFNHPGVTQSMDLRFRHRDGSWRILDAIGKRPAYPPGIDGVVVSSRDVTERKRIEEQARKHQADLSYLLRLSTLGEMASGIAHELNQPLAAITNYAKGCARRIATGASEPAVIVPALEEIATQAMRAGEIIRRLRNFVRKGESRREPLDVNELVQEVARFVDAEVRARGVHLQVDLAPEGLHVCADAIQLEQVILSLVRNGLEAVCAGGEGARELRLRTSIAGDFVEIAVGDTGQGVAADIAEKMFEPFFSTKPGALGMGLSISRSVVEAHGGRLWATANPSRGATFRFTLPSQRSNEDAGSDALSARRSRRQD